MTNGEEPKKGSPWPKIIGCGCLLIILIVGGCSVGGYFYMKSRFENAYENPLENTLGMIANEEQKATILGKTEQIKGFQVEGAAWGFGGVFWGWDIALTADGAVTDTDVQNLIQALDEIIRVEGRLDQADQSLITPR